MKITAPARDDIGAEITDIDLRSLDAAAAQRARDAVYEHKLVVFRDQRLSRAEYVEAARRIGTPQIYFQPNYHHPEHPEIFVSANVKLDGKKIGVSGTGRYWHTDYQFFEQPLPLTMLYPQQLPNAKRETYYVDMERVWRNLPARLRAALTEKRCVHEAKWRYKVQESDIDKSITEILEEFGAQTPPVRHPAVIRHPVHGKHSLYVSEGFTVGVEGLGYEEGKALLAEINAFATREEHVHTHEWREGDILLWDNRPLLHKASNVPKGQPSVSFRIGIYDGLPFYSA